MQSEPNVSFQATKTFVRSYHAEQMKNPLAAAERYAKDAIWRGFYPFGEMTAAEAATRFWRPLQTSVTNLQRREDIFFAGLNQIDGFQSEWVVSMGHLMGLFDDEWLGLKPTRKIVMLRYCEFSRVEAGQITDQAMFFDIPHLAAQAGQPIFAEGTAAELVQPGPQGGRGVLLEDSSKEESETTLGAINAMISDLAQWNNPLPLEDELRLTWHENMIWWGPTGIGASYSIPRYAEQHSSPFRAAFSDRSKTNHLCRVAEGNFGGFFGWPNFEATLAGPFMGQQPTNKRAEFRVIDIYRQQGGKLVENWVFIDLLHFWKQQNRDFLKEATGYSVNSS